MGRLVQPVLGQRLEALRQRLEVLVLQLEVLEHLLQQEQESLQELLAEQKQVRHQLHIPQDHSRKLQRHNRLSNC